MREYPTIAERDGGAALEMLKRRLTEVCREASSVRVTDFESGDPALVDDLVDHAHALLSSALDALDVVSVLYGEGEAPAVPTGESAAAEEPASAPPSDAESIGDVVVLARMDLRNRQRALRALGDRTPRLDRLAAAGGALRTIQKSLSAVDAAISMGADMPRSINFFGESVARSLDVRRRYALFHERVARDGPPAQDTVRERLRSIGNGIAQLLGARTADHLRTGDRALLMMSHAKIRDWLTVKEAAPMHLATGLRLWQDIASIATMFLDVNKREEIVQHDGALVREALRALPTPGDAREEATWDEDRRRALLDRLRSMRGRSLALDACLDAPLTALQIETIRDILTELQRALVVNEGDPASPGGPRV